MAKKPRLLDLFCGAGGAAMGYHMAGFEVVGVDVKPQPNFPFEFVRGDALSWLNTLNEGIKSGRNPENAFLGNIDAIHASPPCQGYSSMAALFPEKEYPMLIDAVRMLLIESSKHWIIENVETAPLWKAPTLFGEYGVMLCGSMFGLDSPQGYLRRHRVFETSFPLPQLSCNHSGKAAGVYGYGGGCQSGRHNKLSRKDAAKTMGIDWMKMHELSEAIPPVYTQWIGKRLMEMLF